MEIEVRQHEMVEVVAAFHVAGDAAAERKRDLAVGRRVNLFAVEGFQIGDGLGQPRF